MNRIIAVLLIILGTAVSVWAESAPPLSGSGRDVVVIPLGTVGTYITVPQGAQGLLVPLPTPDVSFYSLHGPNGPVTQGMILPLDPGPGPLLPDPMTPLNSTASEKVAPCR